MGQRPTRRGGKAKVNWESPRYPWKILNDSLVKPPIKPRNIEQYRWTSGLRLASIKPKPAQPCAEFKGRFHKRHGTLCCGYVHYKNVCYRVVGGIKSILACKHQE